MFLQSVPFTSSFSISNKIMHVNFRKAFLVKHPVNFDQRKLALEMM
jgi:hypothetical protein